MHQKIRKTALLTIFFLFSFLSAKTTFAHVVVNPSEAGIGSYQTFSVGVPVEKDNPTVGLRLLIPEGVEDVTPNVKPGWKINLKKNGEGEAAKVTEINWTGGNIPAGERDDFVFRAQVPATPTTLIWKAYQTYQNGEVVAWDQIPKTTSTSMPSMTEDENTTPYSITRVVNDLQTTAIPPTTDLTIFSILSIAALVFALISLVLHLKKRK